MAYCMMIERGVQLCYQHLRQLYAHGALRSKLDGFSTLNTNIWSVTHGHLLIEDIFFGLSMTTLCVWYIRFAHRLTQPLRGGDT